MNRRQQAWPKPSPPLVVLFNIQRAGAELENLLQHLDRAPQRAGAGKRAVKLRSLGMRLARELDTGKILARVDFQIGKCFVVLEQLIELRLHVLDQPGFHQQRIDLAFGGQEVDVVNFLDQLRGAAIFGRGLEEVAAGPSPQILGLADIDHDSSGVFHQIHARRVREFAHFGEGGLQARRSRFPPFQVAATRLRPIDRPPVLSFRTLN